MSQANTNQREIEMSDLRNEIEKSTGTDNADSDLRSAITEALLNGKSTWLDGETIAAIESIDDASEPRNTAGRTDAGVVRITSGAESVIVGYYSDGGQHVLDLLDEGATVQDWADEWSNQDDVLPEYLRQGPRGCTN